MNDFVIVFGSIMLAFLLGSVVWLWLLRGFIIPWLRAKRGGTLIHINTKGSPIGKFKVGKRTAPGIYEYTDGKDEEGKPQKFIVTTQEGCVRRNIRVNWITVNEGDTAALNPSKVYIEKVPVKYKEKDADGKEIEKEGFVQKTANYLSWDDAHLIDNLLLRAAQKPKLPLGGVFGAFDIKKVLIGAAIVGAGIFLIIYMNGGSNVL